MVRTDPRICSLPALVARAYLDPGMDDFVEQYRRHWPGVVAAAHAVVGRAPEAEEIAQEVFVRLWREPGRFDARRGEIGPYLRMVARSRALDFWRREQAAARARERHAIRNHQPDVAPEERPAEAAIRSDLAHVVRRAVRGLPDAQREAVALAYWGDLSADQIARHTQVPLGTAKSRIRIALEKLRADVAAELAV